MKWETELCEYLGKECSRLKEESVQRAWGTRFLGTLNGEVVVGGVKEWEYWSHRNRSQGQSSGLRIGIQGLLIGGFQPRSNMTCGYGSNPGTWREGTGPGRWHWQEKTGKDKRGIWQEASKVPDDGWGMRESEIKRKWGLKPGFTFCTADSTSRNLS